MPRRTRSDEPPATTPQVLGSLLKSARNIMRKDKGLSGDLDRLPLLTWVMFLKFLDDLEAQREEEAELGGQRFRPAVDPPYRWRDWAADPQGITGDELLAFINQDEAMRPNGTRGLGLFAYLRQLTSGNGDNRRDVIATVFRGVDNRMKSGYLLRDVVNKVAGIHFTSSAELLTLGSLYESMLREMRDAAGDSGEFYTPRPVVRFMVEVTDPRLGETVLDPASGTGGFLVESFNHLSKQVKTVGDRRTLQERSLRGCEPKPLPYLLCQMNLLLHGLNAPQIDPENALRFKLTEIGEKERVDVILTNPPFGGEEEKGIQGNFPEDRQTAETALLFLQVIMRRLKRRPTSAGRSARAAVVVPNGILSGDGVCARIKDELLREFNVHTIVRLPGGVFAPYTPIPSNLVFFDRSGPTSEVWYYEHPLPEERKKYTKTTPLEFEEFDPCRTWWANREENERAWKVSAEELLADCNLDRKNPRSPLDVHVPPERLVSAVVDGSAEVSRRLGGVSSVLSTHAGELNPSTERGPGWRFLKLERCMRQVEDEHRVDGSASYPNFGIYSFGRGLFKKPPIDGAASSATTLYRVRAGQFIYSRLFAFEGSYGLVTPEFDGHYVSNEYPTFECDPEQAMPEFIAAYFQSPTVWRRVAVGSKGLGDRRQRVQPEHILAHEIWLPPKEWQERIVGVRSELDAARERHGAAGAALDALFPAFLDRVFRGEL